MSNRRKHRRRLRPETGRRSAPGTKPGTLIISPDAIPTAIHVIAYDKERILEKNIADPQELKPILEQWPVVWVNVVGLGSEKTLIALAQIFRIHPLALEDVVNVHQRAKVEPYDENVYCVMRIPDPTGPQLTEQLSLFFGKNFVLTLQEGPSDCFDPIRTRLRKEYSLLRQETHPDHLAYRLIDAAVDAYFPILEQIGDHLDELDDRTAAGEGDTAFAELHTIKRELLMLKRAIWPLRDALSMLRSELTPFVTAQTRVYLRDCYDHAVQLMELLESYREIAGDVRDFYLSSISNRMNEVMKTLTIIATIFMPLTFIVGVYGMNFNTDSPWNMPELNWRYGYVFVWAVMIASALAMFYFFKSRGWLKRTTSYEDVANGNGPTNSREER